MKKIITSVLFASLAAMTFGCTAIVPVQANPGDITQATKKGTASCSRFFGLSGDCSIMTAAQSAGITEILVVDQKVTPFKIETIVYGK